MCVRAPVSPLTFVCACARVRVHVCARACAGKRVRVRTGRHACTRACVFTGVCAWMVCLLACVRPSVCLSFRQSVPPRKRPAPYPCVRVSVCSRASRPVCECACARRAPISAVAQPGCDNRDREAWFARLSILHLIPLVTRRKSVLFGASVLDAVQQGCLLVNVVV